MKGDDRLDALQMTFADIHCHTLWGVDDGAKDAESMQKMLDAQYEEGVRYLCFTPHYHPGYYGHNEERAERAFAEAVSYCEKYPDLRLLLANELHYAPECLSWIKGKTCRRLGQTRCVLIDFRENEDEEAIVHGLSRLVNAGYVPILAHAERYLHLNVATVGLLKQDGVLVQVNAASCLGGFGIRARAQARRMLAKRMVDFVSSDAHNLTSRPPQLQRGYQYIAKKYGAEYATYVCRDHAVARFFDKERKENEP